MCFHHGVRTDEQVLSDVRYFTEMVNKSATGSWERTYWQDKLARAEKVAAERGLMDRVS